jgi:hypothetical protein
VVDIAGRTYCTLSELAEILGTSVEYARRIPAGVLGALDIGGKRARKLYALDRVEWFRGVRARWLAKRANADRDMAAELADIAEEHRSDE